MTFASSGYIAFLGVVYLVYHAARHSSTLQNSLLCAASLVLYGSFRADHVGVLVLVAAIGYSCSRSIAAGNDGGRRRATFWGAVVGLLAILALFKYSGSLAQPVGISFYTFCVLGYLADVYLRVGEPARDPLEFATFVSFFPVVASGPIERGRAFLPQLRSPRCCRLEDARRALWLLVYGYFCKIVVASSAAPIADAAFSRDYAFGWTLLLGLGFYGLQLYADFLGYSLIAKGSAQLLGIEVGWNFLHPFFATTISEFWRRWHISLSFWVRDYLFLPLRVPWRRAGRWGLAGATMLSFLVLGLWHGASWPFALYGLLHGAALTIDTLTVKSPQRTLVSRSLGWARTMAVVLAGMFLFRMNDLGQLRTIVGASRSWEWFPAHHEMVVAFLAASSTLAVVEYVQVRSGNEYALVEQYSRAGHWTMAFMLLGIYAMSAQVSTSFLYFQF